MVQCVLLRCDPPGEPLKGTATPLRNNKTNVTLCQLQTGEQSSGLFEIFEIRVLNFVAERAVPPPRVHVVPYCDLHRCT